MKDLISLCREAKLSATSKASKLLQSSKVDEKALAKAMLSTKAYKEDIDIQNAVDSVLKGVIAEEKTKAEEPAQRSTSSRGGEPTRRGW